MFKYADCILDYVTYLEDFYHEISMKELIEELCEIKENRYYVFEMKRHKIENINDLVEEIDDLKMKYEVPQTIPSILNINKDTKSKNIGHKKRKLISVKCYSCNKYGHFARECYYNKNNKKQENVRKPSFIKDDRKHKKPKYNKAKNVKEMNAVEKRGH
ncbi:hypothetical protein DASC09_010380 [Saccharomycopsis crataegensis]|uniref:CCHC-type domain-containing protein n=1 Tax=Saccharomycopsis crataegensis TaxID=43959 RepID=A0AAV5QG41_9ASCO|nr:hypothetical protein DASC09_010380 [Saccharomycopsis crataegensis]